VEEQESSSALSDDLLAKYGDQASHSLSSLPIKQILGQTEVRKARFVD